MEKEWPQLEHKGHYWKIKTVGNVIHTEHGKVGGKAVSSQVTVIKTGNQPTLEAQAQFRAEKQWRDRQEKKNYVSETKCATADQQEALDDLQNVPLPMLSKTVEFRDENGKKNPKGAVVHRMAYPMFGQAKIDGYRCFSDMGDHLYTRTRKTFAGLPTLKKLLQAKRAKLPTTGFGSGRFFLDGELFCDGMSFQKFTKIVKPAEHRPDHDPHVQYRLFDCIDLDFPQTPYEERFKLINSLFKSAQIFVLPVTLMRNRAELDAYFMQCLDEGHEGIMLRDPASPYEVDKRSFHLQKYKPVLDAEFEIVGFKDGQGKEEGAVIWTCKVNAGDKTFDVHPMGTIEQRKADFLEASKYIGWRLTVFFQEYTDDMVPRFPRSKGIRPGFDVETKRKSPSKSSKTSNAFKTSKTSKSLEASEAPVESSKQVKSSNKRKKDETLKE